MRKAFSVRIRKRPSHAVLAHEILDVRVFSLDVEDRRAFEVVEEFLSNGHPVLLRSVAALIAHGDERAWTKASPSHHHHKVGQWLKSFGLVRSHPDIEG